MARWIYQRPVECCDSTELIVAKRLALLSDNWVIRWGFYLEAGLKFWDRSTYELEQWTEDQIAFNLNGFRVSGKLTLDLSSPRACK